MPPAAVEPFVAADTGAFIENLNGTPAVTDVHFFLDLLIGHRIILCLYGDMIIQLDGCHFPLCEFIGMHRKRLHKGGFFLLEYGIAAALPFLERRMVKLIQLFPDSGIHLVDIKKLPVSQPGRDDRRTIVFCHFRVYSIDLLVVPVFVMNQGSLAVVRYIKCPT